MMHPAAIEADCEQGNGCEAARSLTILVVDDDADMRTYLRRCLTPLAPRHVIEASNGDEALLCVETHRPDLVIADIVMPGLDGVALCRAIRDDDRLSGTPVLLVSGLSSADPAEADAILQKPFNAAVLKATIRRMLTPADEAPGGS